MKYFKFLMIISFFLIPLISYSQDSIPHIPNARIVIFKYKNPQFMELTGNGITWFLKDNLEDGLYIGFYKLKHFKDTALYARVYHHHVNGLVKLWDEKGHYLSDEIEYKNGMKNGIWQAYIMVDGKKLTNIYKYENDALDEIIHEEF